jgi:hypothetical protein
MSQSIAEHRRNSFYSSPSELKRRAEARQTEQSPIAKLRSGRRDDENAMGARQRAESQKLAGRHSVELSRDPAIMNNTGNGAPALLKKQRDERAALATKHAAEKSQLRAKHDAAMEAEIAKHPAP